MVFNQIIIHFLYIKKIFFYSHISNPSEYFAIDSKNLLKCEIFQILVNLIKLFKN